MPIFEYKCPKCGKEFEELVLSEAKAVPCPACGATKTKKVLSKCCFKSGGTGTSVGSVGKSSSGCAGCSGGNCSTCK